jgi:hypothetical protein
MKKILFCIIGLLLICACGDNGASPVPQPLFRVISLDKCIPVTNGNQTGVTIGCTATNEGEACGSTSVELRAEKNTIIVGSTRIPISLCPNQNTYVEATLWNIPHTDVPIQCFCRCT